jgi:hypothetical protein
MDEAKFIYKSRFEIGTCVQIANEEFLKAFLLSWNLHDKLEAEQVHYHDQVATVEKVGFYHGGDQLYQLAKIPGIWHEQCLKEHTAIL